MLRRSARSCARSSGDRDGRASPVCADLARRRRSLGPSASSSASSAGAAAAAAAAGASLAAGASAAASSAAGSSAGASATSSAVGSSAGSSGATTSSATLSGASSAGGASSSGVSGVSSFTLSSVSSIGSSLPTDFGLHVDAALVRYGQRSREVLLRLLQPRGVLELAGRVLEAQVEDLLARGLRELHELRILQVSHLDGLHD